MSGDDLTLVRELKKKLRESEAEILRLRSEFVSVIHVCDTQPRNSAQYAREISHNALTSSRRVYVIEEE